MVAMKSTQDKLYEIIFEADTQSGKIFDIALMCVIVFSVVLVMLESVESFYSHNRILLKTLEWIITVIFTVEYGMRIAIVKKPRRYIFSFFGIIDFLAVLPTYIGLLVAGPTVLS